MRVGLVIYGSLETISGGYLYDRMLVEHLRAEGNQVEIISLPPQAYPLLLADNWRRELEQRVLASHLDILVQDELNHPSLFDFNARIREQLGCPIVSIVHHLRSEEQRPAWQNRVYRWIERRYLDSVDALVFNSQSTLQSAEALLESSKPCIVAYPGGDRLGSAPSSEFVSARARQPGPLQLLLLGNVIPRKHVRTVLAALGQLPGDQWRLTVAGSLTSDPAYVARVRSQARRHGLEGKVRFTGALTDAEITTMLARNHLLVVPSSFEGYGIVYAEAMHWGLPVIASTSGGAREIVEHGVNGALIEAGDVQSLTAEIKSLVDNRPRLEALSLAAYERASTLTRWGSTTAAISGFLRSVAG